ncbi:MOSC N-terminal beta barrel domain-containing protein [Phlebopus sp. FC_14]|nr:MOSC N-terminal beta barrel domain-containing protein [Phlebopus sp. FC_14]
MAESMLDHGLMATLQTFSIPIVLLLAPFALLTLSNKLKISGSKQSVDERATDPTTADYSKFDTSNVRVTKILIHPIKSCKGTSVQEAKYTLEGLEHDRKWCILNADNSSVVTARQFSKMVLIHPRIVPDGSSPEGGRLEVSFPDDSGCETFSIPLNPTEGMLRQWRNVDDAELWGKKDIDGYICETLTGRSPSVILSEYFGYAVHLVVKGPRPRICPPTLRFPKLDAPSYFQDGYPLLIVSEESLAAVQARVRDMIGVQGVAEKWETEELVVERFRPNIVFKGAGAPFLEDIVTELSIDSHPEVMEDAAPPIHLVSKCARCLLPNVDTSTGIRDNAVPYKAMMKFRRGLDPARVSAPCFGCNGILTGEGTVRVGNWVHVRKMGFV